MNTNIANPVIINAGILHGCEYFAQKPKEGYTLYSGQLLKPNQLPVLVEQLMMDDFKVDRKAFTFLKKMGITGFRRGFEQYKFCKYGGIDSVSDFDLETNKLTPDAFNNMCSSTTCQLRGKFCGVASGITCDDYNTLIELVSGRSSKQAADELHLANASVKSRIAKLKEKLGAKNTPELTYIAGKLGIKAHCAS